MLGYLYRRNITGVRTDEHTRIITEIFSNVKSAVQFMEQYNNQCNEFNFQNVRQEGEVDNNVIFLYCHT